MLIREVKKLEQDAEFENLEAEVNHCKATKLEGGTYFQWVSIGDHTGSTPARFFYGNKRRSLCNGTIVIIKHGIWSKTEGIYVEDYSISTTSEPPPGSHREYKPDDAMTKTDWEAKDKRMAKMCSLNNATALVVCLAEIMKKPTDSGFVPSTKKAAKEFLDWIFE